MNTSKTHAPSRSTARRQFMERLGIYLLGIAIGLFMLGLLWNARARSAAAERENAVEHTDPPGPSEERSPR